jgi:hypothetical protein
MPWDDQSGRTGLDPWAMQSQADADQKVREVESRHPSMGGASAEARSLRAWVPLLVVLAVGFVILLVMSLPR